MGPKIVSFAGKNLVFLYAMSDMVTFYKKSAVDSMDMFLRNFSKVPDDRLTWTPAPGAKSALRVGAHTALYAGRFASMIRDRRLPQPENLEAWLAERNAEEAAVSSREEVEKIFRQGTEEVLAALDGLSPEEIEMRLDSGQGWSVPMTQLMNLPGWHAVLHMGQIDFLQTCWGDQEIYVS